MRRTPTIGQQMAAYMRPIYRGRIDVHSLGYRFGDDGYANPQGVHFRSFPSDDGRMVELYKRRSVRCPVHNHDGQDFPIVRGRASVPLTFCQKCPMRIRGIGCCSVLREEASK